jgi:hypothetical protein
VNLGFRAWLAATTVSTLGDSVTFFALGWAASSYGADAAGLVLTLGSLPLAVFILLGGAVADRFGIRRTMIACDAAMVLVMVAFAAHAVGGATVTGLCLLALASGTATALRRPAEGAFPRLFADDEELARVMARVSIAQQAARFSGPPLAGLLLASGGLALTAGGDAATFALVLLTLCLVRPPREAQVVRTGEPVLAAIWSAMGAAVRTPGLVPLLLGVTALAASALTVVMLSVPLVGRDRGWSAGETGLVAASWIAGSLVVTAVVAWRGPAGPPARVLGPVVGAAGILLLAGTGSVALGAVAVGLLGVGTAVWTTVALPLFVRLTPPDKLARFQSLLHLAQTGATLVALPLVSAVAGVWGPDASLVLTAAIMLATSVPRWPALTPRPALLD